MKREKIFDSSSWKAMLLYQIKNIVFFGIAIILEYVLLEFSSGQITYTFSIEHFRNIILGIGTVLVLNIFVLLLTGSYFTSVIVSGVIISVLSVVNYFVIQYHGQPFIMADLKNIKSGLTVIQNYSLSVDATVFMVVFGCILLFVFSYFLFKGKRLSRVISAPVFLFSLVCIYFAYMSPNCYMSRADNSPNWVWALQEVGYTPYFVHRSILASEPIKEPDGYEEKDTKQFATNYLKSGNESNAVYPDIVFILNETYFDLDTLIDTGMRDEVFTTYDAIEGIKGYTVVPQLAGGTNCSEYEYLTCNSTHLIPYASPFVYLDMENSNSIISYLENLGYNTLGMHPFNATCYSRNIVYPQIGFNDILWREDCENREFYGNRYNLTTDASAYHYLIDWYESSDSEYPKCMYCLTIQNHGQWNFNDDEEDIIKTTNDFGELTDDINEYLSCMKLSDDALGYLVDYFSSVKRDVIIVMAGDHCPSFLPDLVSNAGDLESNLKMRATPFLIWSNHLDLDESIFENCNYYSMNYLVPSVLKSAKIPLSGYYQYLCDLKSNYPIIEEDNGYYDKDYQYFTYSSENELPENLKRYFSLEYLNITNPKEAIEFFE